METRRTLVEMERAMALTRGVIAGRTEVAELKRNTELAERSLAAMVKMLGELGMRVDEDGHMQILVRLGDETEARK